MRVEIPAALEWPGLPFGGDPAELAEPAEPAERDEAGDTPMVRGGATLPRLRDPRNRVRTIVGPNRGI